jgi:O-antigen/teichoic acid export membrane protein
MQLKQLRSNIAEDSLYRNSLFLMGSTFIVAISGFLYWLLAAHVYSTRSVGLVATIIAISNVVMVLSALGYDNSFIRFLPKAKNRDEQLDTGFTITALASLIVSSAYLVIIHLFVPKLSFVDGSIFWIALFLAYMVTWMLNFLNNYPFIAYRITHIVFGINTGMGFIRLVFLFLFKPLGLTGLFLSYAVAVFLAMIVTFYYMKKTMNYRFHLRINWPEFKRTQRYALLSYLSIVFLTLPAYILPTFVVSKLGASDAAYYYIVAVIIAALNVIPQATSQSLFAEGVWLRRKLNEQLVKAFKIIYLLTIPAVLVLVVGGSLILKMFGGGYQKSGYLLLVLLAISGLPKALSYMLSAILRVEHHVGRVALIYGIYALIILGGSYWGVKTGHKLSFIGWITLIAEGVVAIIFTVDYFIRNRSESKIQTNS